MTLASQSFCKLSCLSSHCFFAISSGVLGGFGVGVSDCVELKRMECECETAARETTDATRALETFIAVLVTDRWNIVEKEIEIGADER